MPPALRVSAGGPARRGGTPGAAPSGRSDGLRRRRSMVGSNTHYPVWRAARVG